LQGTPEPIPYREILLTTQIMDEIFLQLNEQHGEANLPTEELLNSAPAR